MLFEKQYILTQTIETETRYRTETRTDSEGNTYTVEVPYTYYICNVKLENFDLSHLPIYILTEEQMGFYAAYMQTLGNRPDLFPNGSYPHASIPKEPTYYEIPPEALKDEAFAAMIAEAEKYVGYPMCGAAAPQAPALIVPASLAGLSIIPAGMWNARRRRGFTTSALPFPRSRPSPATLYFSSALMTLPGCPMWGCMWEIRSCCTAATPFPTRTSIQATGSSNFYCYGRLP